MQLELNHIYNMDCMDGMRLMVKQGINVDTMLTDIPYAEINRKSNGLRNLNKSSADVEMFYLSEFLNLADQVVTENFIIFCALGQMSAIRNRFCEMGYSTRLLIWEKTNPSPMNGKHIYLSGVETAVYAKKPKGTFNGFCKNTVMRYPSVKNAIHDTQKPLELWYEILIDTTNEGQIVFDPCMGSFTTAVACHKIGRRFIGFEINSDYYASGAKRLAALQSQVGLFDANCESVFDAIGGNLK